MGVLVEDEFTRCFQSAEHAPWNWNLYLFPLWVLGILVRHLVLLPVRLLIVVVGNVLMVLFFFVVCPLVRDRGRRLALQKWLLRAYCNMWLASWGAVVRYHGIRPRRHANQVIVANHTTVFDVVLINAQTDTAIIGQKQPGLIGFLQTNFLSATGGVWFDRKDTHDRSFVARKLKEHIQCEDNAALLVFPEGTCVNNEYCIQFKKGAFELGAIIYPVAIKYNRIFCDAFWNSRKQSFVRHIYNLMTSWALVADVWYLDPQVIQPGETSVQFAARVKAMIAKKAGLVNVDWDGYLKYFKPNDKLVQDCKRHFADELRAKLQFRVDNPGVLCSGPPSPPQFRRRLL